MRMHAVVLVTVLLACFTDHVAAKVQAAAAGLELRDFSKGWSDAKGIPIPPDAVRVFVYEGGFATAWSPIRAAVTADHIAVDYGRSGVLFNRKTGQVVRRLTVADGWPGARPEEFPPLPVRTEPMLVDPGLASVYRDSHKPKPTYYVAATVEFGGCTWKAFHPTDWTDTQDQETGDYHRQGISWTKILQKANARACLEATNADKTAAYRYTMAEGLASNLVTHFLLTRGGTILWAACVDIYDPEKKEWGPGGLCRFDPDKGQWNRVAAINGREVRWVTLLQEVGGDQWVGFCEGSGLAGDRIYYGKGMYVEQYRPEVTKMVLAQRDDKNTWTTFTRDPVPNTKPPWSDPKSPTEVLRKLARVGDKVLIYSERKSRRPGGGWEIPMEGVISILDLAGGSWRVLDVEKDFGAYEILDMVAEGGEVLAITDRGLHRWTKDGWVFLDSQPTLKNPSVGLVTPVGDELWVGYTRKAFGVLGQQGISRYSERTGQWTYVSAQEIGSGASVRKIIALPGGEVWVLLGPPPELGMALVEFSIYPNQYRNAHFVAGLARYADGKWEFPAKLEGVPESEELQYKTAEGMKTRTEPLPILGIVALGDQLFVFNRKGVYMGPKPWKLIAERDAKVWMEFEAIGLTSDGKSLEIFRQVCENPVAGGPVHVERAEYNPADGKVVFQKIPDESEARDRYDLLVYGASTHLRRGKTFDEPELRQIWTSIPAPAPGRWVVGDLQTNDYHRVVETPYAVWIVSPGELIRLDRERLKAWIGQKHERVPREDLAGVSPGRRCCGCLGCP